MLHKLDLTLFNGWRSLGTVINDRELSYVRISGGISGIIQTRCVVDTESMVHWVVIFCDRVVVSVWIEPVLWTSVVHHMPIILRLNLSFYIFPPIAIREEHLLVVKFIHFEFYNHARTLHHQSQRIEVHIHFQQALWIISCQVIANVFERQWDLHSLSIIEYVVPLSDYRALVRVPWGHDPISVISF